MQGQRGGKEQPSIVDQAVVVEGDVNAVGVAVVKLTTAVATSKLNRQLGAGRAKRRSGVPTQVMYRPAGVHLDLARQVMTPIPPSDVLFSDEATNKEETHWHPTTGSISRPLKTMTV